MARRNHGNLMGDNLNNDDWGLPTGFPGGVPGMVPFLNGNAHLRPEQMQRHFPYLIHLRQHTVCEGCQEAFANDIHGLFWQLPGSYRLSDYYFSNFSEVPEAQADNRAFVAVHDSTWDEVPSVDDPGYQGPGWPETGRDVADRVSETPWEDALDQGAHDSLDTGTLWGPQDTAIEGNPYPVLVGYGHRFCPRCRRARRRRVGGEDESGLYRPFLIQYNDGNVIGLNMEGAD